MPISSDDVSRMSRTGPDGLKAIELSVPEMHCGGCIQKIEKALQALPAVRSARANLSTRRVSVQWQPEQGDPRFDQALENAGFDTHIYQPAETDVADQELSNLIKSLAVSGFAAANIMMLSMGVWYGAAVEMRGLFHWISAALAFVALGYSGRIFYRSAFRALSNRTTNMDVPISIGLILTFTMSLYDTVFGAKYVYFDAATMLLFFLLIGRTLDHAMRERARTAVNGLEALYAKGANIIDGDGKISYRSISEIKPGMQIQVAAGERIAVDGVVTRGVSEIDSSIVTGEPVPQHIEIGARLVAGMLNLSAPITIIATASARESFVAQMIQLMGNTENSQSRFRSLADRAAGYYTPVVHLAALAAFLLWLGIDGDMHNAVSIAVSVLIITCPCALALAVPMVHVVASKRLFENGILVKSGVALERLKNVDTVVFDKTGTLTEGLPVLSEIFDGNSESLAIAYSLASHSKHPYSQAIVKDTQEMQGPSVIPADIVSERVGDGIEARTSNGLYRLGRAAWSLTGRVRDETDIVSMTPEASVYLSRNGKYVAGFAFSDSILPSASVMMNLLRQEHYTTQILSGDRKMSVQKLAETVAVDEFFSDQSPEDKLHHIQRFRETGNLVMMVGDGLNDMPALAAAHVSMTPSHAADVGRSKADFVFLNRDLVSVYQALLISKQAYKLTKQNIALAIAYNIVAVPLAFLGLVTPLIAAVAMSSSSIIVVANSLRIRVKGHRSMLMRRDDNEPNMMEVVMA